jgi:hypothetical protein
MSNKAILFFIIMILESEEEKSCGRPRLPRMNLVEREEHQADKSETVG